MNRGFLGFGKVLKMTLAEKGEISYAVDSVF